MLLLWHLLCTNSNPSLVFLVVLQAEVISEDPVVEGGDETGRRLGNGGHTASDTRSAVIARYLKYIDRVLLKTSQ